MKLRHGIAIGCITALLGLGAFAGVASNVKPVEKAEASSTTDVYMKTSANWNTHRQMTYFNAGGEHKWFITATFSLNEEMVVCYTDSKTAQATDQRQLKIGDSVIFDRTSDSNANWQCKIAGTYNIYIKDGIDSWGNISNAVSISKPIIEDLPANTASTTRVWTRASFDWWYYDYAATAIKYTVSSVDHFCLMPSIQNSDDGLYYWYADIPTNASGFQFVRMALDHATIYNYSVYRTTFYSTGVLYINDTGEGSDRDVSQGTVEHPSGALFAKVLEGFTTCLNSAVNGYKAYDSLETNWYNKLTASGKTSLSSIYIDDYDYDDYVAANKNYAALSSRTDSIKASDKWEAMGNMNDHGSVSLSAIVREMNGGNSNDSMLLSAITVGSAVVLASGFFLLKKKKEL